MFLAAVKVQGLHKRLLEVATRITSLEQVILIPIPILILILILILQVFKSKRLHSYLPLFTLINAKSYRNYPEVAQAKKTRKKANAPAKHVRGDRGGKHLTPDT